MAVPKKKISKSRGRMRRAHIKCSVPSLTRCPNCKTLVASHSACPNCGKYKGRDIIELA